MEIITGGSTGSHWGKNLENEPRAYMVRDLGMAELRVTDEIL